MVSEIKDTAGTGIEDTSAEQIHDTSLVPPGGCGVVSLSLTLNSVTITQTGAKTVLVGTATLTLTVKSIAADLPGITDWLQGKFEEKIYSPQRRFYIGTSDYSERVTKWPIIRRTANEVKSVKVNIPLANNDGALNTFYEATYSMVNTISIQLGDTHPESGWEDIDLFTGYMYGVKYQNKQCIIEARDRLWDFTQRKVGDTDSVTNIPEDVGSGDLPSEIAWVLCTCYGGLDTTKSALNPDIDWNDFAAWAAQFSANNVEAHGYYSGLKVAEALTDLANYTESAIVIEGDGKLHFKRFSEVNSNDYTWTHDQIIKLSIDVNKHRLVNKQWVYWDYSIESDYYIGKVFSQNTISVNTFGLYEDIIERESIWYVDSPSALNIAQRKTNLLAEPPKYFELNTGLDGIWRKIGETARFVDSFYNVTSGAGWRIVEREINLHEGTVKVDLDEATILNAFYLDISYLDGDEYLL